MRISITSKFAKPVVVAPTILRHVKLVTKSKWVFFVFLNRLRNFNVTWAGCSKTFIEVMYALLQYAAVFELDNHVHYSLIFASKVPSLNLWDTLMCPKWHYGNTYKDFTNNINKWDITNMFLFTLISKVIYK